MEKLLEIILVLLFMLVGSAIIYLYDILWLRLEKIRKKLRRQGIKGPEPSMIYGNTLEMKRIRQELKCVQRQETNLNNYISIIFPHFLLWRKTYGPIFLYSTGAVEILHVAQPEMVKDMCHWTPSEVGRPHYLMKSRKPLFGEGILAANGDLWAYEKKILAPEFFVEKIKGMIGLIVDATVPLLQAWENVLDGTGDSKEIYVDGYLRNFSADVIARACFGSSFTQGKDIFCKLRQLQKAISQQDTFVGFSALWKYLPTKSNREIRKLDQEVRLLILDLYQRPINSSAAEDFIVDNCKNIYFAGHETTAVTATWCLMLLAAHPDWQVRARAEALEVCRGQTMLDIHALRQLKILTTVIQETLRLYPPASLIMREAMTDIRLGGVDVPRGTIIQVAISMLHLDKEVWGPDADEFRPDRFANGAAAACKPAHMYMPFGYGPRLCTGQNLAMAELKVVLALLLTKFSFSMSPGYQHTPSFRLTIEPEFGMPLIVTRLL
ncbi:Cytochrome P450 714C3 [Dichanthelium oligosanthes]|uniref:Cytochrome P450 714C3 n=1 Tax=Dichanthelium oligosanthes TaxID=888268 RepID=A0A1E5ULN1_9POAL|nr:Cytochrome P450 714C3 [Dichanthelium oligosanthes]